MKKYAYLAGSIACIFFLYFLGAISHPDEIHLSELEKYEGKSVVVKGMVVYREIKGRSELIKIRDGNYSADVFNYGFTSISYGDIIEVKGRVQRYHGKMEIVADSIKLVEKWDVKSIPLWELSENFERYLGTNVNVTGYVDGVYSSYFYLVDASREYRIKVVYAGNFSGEIKNHEHVYVKSMLEYDKNRMSMYLEMKENEHGIGIID
jgi:hypothetical protein